MKHNCIKLSQIILCTWNLCLLPLPTLNYVARWHRMLRIKKCLISNPWTLVPVLVFLWRDSMVESFLFALHRRETLSAGLLEDSEETVCVRHKRAKGRKRSVSLSTKEVGAARGLVTVGKRECVHICLGRQPALQGESVVSVPASVERCNSETLRFCRGIRSCGGHSGCLECHMVLCWSAIPLGWLH
jgi:hypothetical protein